jgi:hypothetical protein
LRAPNAGDVNRRRPARVERDGEGRLRIILDQSYYAEIQEALEGADADRARLLRSHLLGTLVEQAYRAHWLDWERGLAAGSLPFTRGEVDLGAARGNSALDDLLRLALGLPRVPEDGGGEEAPAPLEPEQVLEGLNLLRDWDFPEGHPLAGMRLQNLLALAGADLSEESVRLLRKERRGRLSPEERRVLNRSLLIAAFPLALPDALTPEHGRQYGLVLYREIIERVNRALGRDGLVRLWPLGNRVRVGLLTGEPPAINRYARIQPLRGRRRRGPFLVHRRELGRRAHGKAGWPFDVGMEGRAGARPRSAFRASDPDGARGP